MTNYLSCSSISLFLPSLHGGGAERVMVRLARGFVQKGLKVDMVLAKAEGPYLSELPKEVRVIDLNSKRVLYSLPRLVRYLRYEKPDILISTATHANIIAVWAKKFAGFPHKLAVREASTISISSAHSRSLRGKWLPLLARLFYPKADFVVANSEGSAEDLKRVTRVPPEKLRVIYNPLDLENIIFKAEEPLNHPWFETYGVILAVGRLTKAKDFSTLIKAFSIVRSKVRAKLVILGEGEERPKLEGLVKELGLEKDVDMPGFVENPYKYMKRASVFVLSSRWEGLPNALLEALALGVPVVAADCPSGPREILEGGKWGKLVPVGDVEGLARAILAQLREPLLPCPLENLKARYGLAEVASQYLDALLRK